MEKRRKKLGEESMFDRQTKYLLVLISVSIILWMLCVVFTGSITVKAAEIEYKHYEYSGNLIVRYKNGNSASDYHRYLISGFDINSDYRVYGFCDDSKSSAQVLLFSPSATSVSQGEYLGNKYINGYYEQIDTKLSNNSVSRSQGAYFREPVPVNSFVEYSSHTEEKYGFVANFPIFESKAALENYLKTGDDSGLVNPPAVVQDDTLSLAGFDCDNTIRATWTDYVCGREINSDYLTIGVSAVYTDGENSSQVAQNVVRYSAMSFEKAYADYAALNPYGEAAELVLKFLPMYMDTENNTTYEGRAISVYFNADGSVREIIEGGAGSGSGNQSDNVNVQYWAPELSHLGHNGFKVLNMDSENQQLYLDIKMESCLYGVKHEKIAGSWVCTTDLSWRYREHDYGYLDRDVSVNQSTVNINELYGIDNVQKLTDDFLAWSEEYPDHWDLPTYSMLKSSSAAKTQYALRNVYNSSRDTTAQAQMIISEQACTTYYVRFYTIDNDIKTYGPWMQYVYRDGANVFGANISMREAYEDEDGNFIVKNEVQGTQDYDTGDITYDSDKEWYELSVDKAMDSGMSGFKDTITEIGGTVSVLPDYVAKLFSFLPWWCNSLIAAGVGAVVILRFLGR